MENGEWRIENGRAEGRGQRESEGQEKDECPTSNEKQKKMKQRAEVEKLRCLEWINIRV